MNVLTLLHAVRMYMAEYDPIGANEVRELRLEGEDLIINQIRIPGKWAGASVTLLVNPSHVRDGLSAP